MGQLRRELPIRLAAGKASVLKQYRGNGGRGVWKVEIADRTSSGHPHSLIRVRHAIRGCVEEEITLEDFFTRCTSYFKADGKLIDQAYQPRLPEGMVRCYLVQDRVVGFGHQAVNALFPPPPGAPQSAAPQPGPRLYHPPTMPEFQLLKRKVEQEWMPAMQQLLHIDIADLPILWDCDFLLGPKKAPGEDTYVFCEINVSSVAPFPESAPPYVAEATLARIEADRRKRQFAIPK